MTDVVRLKGSPYRMGVEYGRRCAKEIADAIATFHLVGKIALTPGYRSGHPTILRMLSAFLPFSSQKAALRSLSAKYLDAIQRYSPETLDEMKGISEGAQVRYEDVVYLNVFPEAVEGCSTWVACGAATTTGEPLLAMNTDAFKPNRRAQIVLSVEPEGAYRHIGTALAGIVTPHHGINEHGLAIAYMSLLARKPDTRTFGVPAYMIVSRILRRCANVHDALQELTRVSLSSAPSAFFFADKQRAARVETALCEYDTRVIEDGADGCCMRPSLERTVKHETTFTMMPQMTVNAVPRTRRMDQLLRKYSGRLDVQTMMDIAKDHGEAETAGKSICQHSRSPLGGVTIGSFVAKPRDGKIWVTHGNPCRKEYREFAIQPETEWSDTAPFSRP